LWQHAKQLRMSLQEIKDEMKEAKAAEMRAASGSASRSCPRSDDADVPTASVV